MSPEPPVNGLSERLRIKTVIADPICTMTDRLRLGPARLGVKKRRRASTAKAPSSLNRPQFAGGSKVSMDGAYGKK